MEIVHACLFPFGKFRDCHGDAFLVKIKSDALDYDRIHRGYYLIWWIHHDLMCLELNQIEWTSFVWRSKLSRGGIIFWGYGRLPKDTEKKFAFFVRDQVLTPCPQFGRLKKETLYFFSSWKCILTSSLFFWLYESLLLLTSAKRELVNEKNIMQGKICLGLGGVFKVEDSNWVFFLFFTLFEVWVAVFG